MFILLSNTKCNSCKQVRSVFEVQKRCKRVLIRSDIGHFSLKICGKDKDNHLKETHKIDTYMLKVYQGLNSQSDQSFLHFIDIFILFIDSVGQFS